MFQIFAELEERLSPFVKGFEDSARAAVAKAKADAEVQIENLRHIAQVAVSDAKADAEKELTVVEPKVKAAVLAAIDRAFEALLASSVL